MLQVAAAVSRTLSTETVKVRSTHHVEILLPCLTSGSTQDCVMFLTGQVDAFLPILRSDSAAISLASTKEAALLVNILYQILRTRNSAVSVLLGGETMT